MTRLLSQGYRVNCLANTFKTFYGRHTDLVGKYRENVCQMFADDTCSNDFFFIYFYLFPPGFVRAELIKLAKTAGVMHEVHHAYSIQCTW